MASYTSAHGRETWPDTVKDKASSGVASFCSSDML